MATAMAAARLQPDGVDAVHRYVEVVHAVRELGSSSGVRVRAVAALGGYPHPPRGVSSESRGRVCRDPFFRTSSPRREALVSAMGEGERDITDMQETDKVSGEWWKSVLTAVHEWSSDKLLGLAELADGSLFFSFGGSDSARPAARTSAQPRAQSETKMNGSTHNVTPTAHPQRQPSSFQKHSPIPASRKKASVSKEDVATAQPHAEDKKTQKAQSPSKPTRPPRPPSFFYRRSPIPKVLVSVPASTSKKKSRSPEVPPTTETPTKETPAKATSAKATPAKGTPAKETPAKATPAKGTPAKETPAKATSAKATPAKGTPAKGTPAKGTPAKGTPAKGTPAKGTPAKAAPAKAAVDSEKDSPFSPELKEILTHDEGTGGQESRDTAKSKTDAKTSSAAPAKKKSSKPASEETEIFQTIENGAVSEDLESYKLPELRNLAKARGLKGYSKLKKGELVDLLASSKS